MRIERHASGHGSDPEQRRGAPPRGQPYTRVAIRCSPSVFAASPLAWQRFLARCGLRVRRRWHAEARGREEDVRRVADVRERVARRDHHHSGGPGSSVTATRGRFEKRTARWIRVSPSSERARRSWSARVKPDDAERPSLDDTTITRLREETPGIAGVNPDTPGGVAHFNNAGSALPHVASSTPSSITSTSKPSPADTRPPAPRGLTFSARTTLSVAF